MCFAQGHNKLLPVAIEPTEPDALSGRHSDPHDKEDDQDV